MLSLILIGKITFGQGLGDFYYLILLLLLLIVFVYIFLKNSKKKRSLPLFVSIIQFLIIALFILKITIWRGIEYPWNGFIFYE